MNKHIILNNNIIKSVSKQSKRSKRYLLVIFYVKRYKRAYDHKKYTQTLNLLFEIVEEI